jgi:hypothetical protein
MKVSYPIMPMQNFMQLPVADDQFLPWLKIGGIALSGMTTVWMVLLALANWSELVYLFKYPTVGSVLYFGFMIVLLSISVLTLLLGIALQLNDFVKYSLVDDLTIALSVVIFIVLTGGISLLVSTFKVLSWRVNLSIILTLFYPLSACGLLIYLLQQIPVTKPNTYQVLEKPEASK